MRLKQWCVFLCLVTLMLGDRVKNKMQENAPAQTTTGKAYLDAYTANALLTTEERRTVALLQRIQIKIATLEENEKDEFVKKISNYKDRIANILSKLETIPGMHGLNVTILRTNLDIPATEVHVEEKHKDVDNMLSLNNFPEATADATTPRKPVDDLAMVPIGQASKKPTPPVQLSSQLYHPTQALSVPQTYYPYPKPTTAPRSKNPKQSKTPQYKTQPYQHELFSSTQSHPSYDNVTMSVNFDKEKYNNAVAPDADQAQQVLSLQAELGYLRKKLAKCGAHVNSEVYHFVPIFVITPTYTRHVQKAELTRLSNVFLLVPNLHWIVVKDSNQKSNLVKNFLHKSGLKYTHLNIETPIVMKLDPKDPRWKGIRQRNKAISWLGNNFQAGDPGVVYFADDDNSYSMELFQEISVTKKVSVFPVGLVGGVMVEKPKVVSGKVVGWSVGWGTDRTFATDMAGFAVNLSYLLSHSRAKFQPKAKIGHQETDFLEKFVRVEDLEPLSIDKVLVWHTRTEMPNLNMEKKFQRRNGHSSDYGLKM